MCDSSVCHWECRDKRRGHAPLLSLHQLPIDDETQLDAGTQSYNIHVPDHDNNSAILMSIMAIIIMLILVGLTSMIIMLLISGATTKMGYFDFWVIVGVHRIVRVHVYLLSIIMTEVTS